MKGCDWLEKRLALKYKMAMKITKQKIWAIFIMLQKRKGQETAGHNCGYLSF